MRFTKKFLIWAVIGGVIYFLLSYHVIFMGVHVKLLKKSRRTFDYTFVSLHAKSNKAILSVDDLREDGIGELLLETGKISEEELARILAEIEEEQKDE
ncbi:MAG: hypothetical protein JRF57_06050 [Deltaproteobacteria bacterium]|nr:hypothetical protein [Deltaproteobacteria bacterium]